MIKTLLLLLVFIVMITSLNRLFASEKMNPFLIPSLISCEELEAKLSAQLKVWRYNGYIHRNDNESRQHGGSHNEMIALIQLIDSNSWIQLSNVGPSIQLSPWRIIAISSQSIEWQADLPLYCQKKLIITMIFEGK